MANVHIREVNFAVEITEPIGPLQSEDVRKIATAVMEMLDRRSDLNQQRNRDTRVRDRVWDPDKG